MDTLKPKREKGVDSCVAAVTTAVIVFYTVVFLAAIGLLGIVGYVAVVMVNRL